jgi:hypothetical protein
MGIKGFSHPTTFVKSKQTPRKRTLFLLLNPVILVNTVDTNILRKIISNRSLINLNRKLYQLNNNLSHRSTISWPNLVRIMGGLS